MSREIRRVPVDWKHPVVHKPVPWLLIQDPDGWFIRYGDDVWGPWPVVHSPSVMKIRAEKLAGCDLDWTETENGFEGSI